MTLRWGTGFDLMRTETDARDQFAQLGWYELPGGPIAANLTIADDPTDSAFGYGKVLKFGNTNVSGNDTQANYLLKNGVEMVEWYQGARVIVNSALVQTKPFLGIGRTGETLISAAFKEYGQIELWRGREDYPGAVLLATSNPGSYLNDVWLYFEIGGLLATDTTGWVTVRVNTVPVISLVTSITNPGGANLNSVVLGYFYEDQTGVGNVRAWWDDLYICDEQGMENNTFLGNIRVQGLKPNAAGASTTWTPFGAMTNWEAASNEDIDDTKYVYSLTPGDYDLYEIEPLVNTPAVFGVQVTGFYRQDDATQRSVKNVIFSGATQDEGVEFFTNSDYAASTDMWENDPDTGNLWLYPDVNNVQIGPKVET